MAELQSRAAVLPSPDLFNEILTTKAEFDLLAMSDAIEALHTFFYNYYECGDKPGKLLAHQLRQSSNLNNITQSPTINPSNINNQFRDFL